MALVLFCYIENPELKELYKTNIKKRDKDQLINYPYNNAGFDLYCVDDLIIEHHNTKPLNLQIKCAMYEIKYESSKHDSYETRIPIAFYLYPRSSISKTPLRLANCVGIIDNNYRGNIIAMLDNTSDNDFIVNKHDRLVQICSPNLSYFTIKIVDTLDELGQTDRGEHGIGSTGK